MQKLSRSEIRNKIYGCFLGKNIGGTLGMPFEGTTETNDVTFYTQKLSGVPVPNDDLDLQLVWLALADFYGLEHLTSRHFGEMWIDAIIGPWGEYSHAHWNCMAGFMPPLSGACDNDAWKLSNGAWIRSEIWACLFAGRPDKALHYAWMDASADHVTEGIYAELFTTSLEAAAFYESNVETLVRIACGNVPKDSRIRKVVELVLDGFKAGKDWKQVRDEAVASTADMGWFQAPCNVAFVVIGLLFGDGDFGKTICTAVNCGDDTDCTGATAGSVMGIILGADAIPKKWLDPIGDSIASCSFNRFSIPVDVPKTVTELTDRIMAIRDMQCIRDPAFDIPQESFTDTTATEAIWARSSYELRFNLLFAELGIDYLQGPYLTPGQPCPLRLTIRDGIAGAQNLRFHWVLPEGWSSSNGTDYVLGNRNYCTSAFECDIIPPETLNGAMSYLTLEVRTDVRQAPALVSVPFRRKGAYTFVKAVADTSTAAYDKLKAVSRRVNSFKQNQ
ncbi:MAG: ADP-ribosylglycohydrolase family protein [Victivallales bacterium]|nr:ADP-ribosylglycohydrolase family protein [Victivallales bacterium]